MLFSEPKIPQSIRVFSETTKFRVSVLFSEPKIPQYDVRDAMRACGFSFSALQRAENSSIPFPGIPNPIRLCFSALQRAENSSIDDGTPNVERIYRCFSALQRAENSSILIIAAPSFEIECFSALQRAENSSIWRVEREGMTTVAFQCSSASRKFLNVVVYNDRWESWFVSVLFSEPKIPQWYVCTYPPVTCPPFQCSSASRKFLNYAVSIVSVISPEVSVLFSEPKIPQSRAACTLECRNCMFQCSSASRKFLNAR